MCSRSKRLSKVVGVLVVTSSSMHPATQHKAKLLIQFIHRSMQLHTYLYVYVCRYLHLVDYPFRFKMASHCRTNTHTSISELCAIVLVFAV